MTTDQDRATCRSKRRYPTLKAAKRAASYQRRRALVPYRCPVGDHWHLRSAHTLLRFIERKGGRT